MGVAKLIALLMVLLLVGISLMEKITNTIYKFFF